MVLHGGGADTDTAKVIIGDADYSKRSAGGGSGGGSINIFYKTEFIEGTLEAKGGSGGTGGKAGDATEGSSGGAGGAGTKTVTQLEI